MQLDEILTSRLEQLARLALSDQERQDLLKDLNQILEMVSKMEELDTEGVEPLTHMTPVVNNWRADVVKGHLDRRIVMDNAPQTDGTFFKVPKVIDLK